MSKALELLKKLTSQEDLVIKQEFEKIQEDNTKLNEEKLQLEIKLIDLTSKFNDLATQFSAIKSSVLPTGNELNEQPRTAELSLPQEEILPRESHLFIKELLLEIREFDGNSDVLSFIDQITEVRKQLRDDRAIESLIRKVIAIKIKGRAQEVVERHSIKNLAQLKECRITHFGPIELEYEQLAEMRDAMRHRTSKPVKEYINRFNNINRRIQRAIDCSDEEFRDMRRAYETKFAVSKFIRGLYPTELKLCVQHRQPQTLPVAFQLALHEEKIQRDDENLRSRQNSRSSRREEYNRTHRTSRSYDQKSREPSHSRERYR